MCVGTIWQCMSLHSFTLVEQKWMYSMKRLYYQIIIKYLIDSLVLLYM
jgi:hypothetical protein